MGLTKLWPLKLFSSTFLRGLTHTVVPCSFIGELTHTVVFCVVKGGGTPGKHGALTVVFQ